jgi:isoamylase
LGTDSAFPNASPQGPANGVEPGTYAAVLAKVNHIVGVGATTVLLLPVQACLNRDGGDNFGQNPISLFACDSRLAGARATSGEPAHQLRQLIRGLQRHGLEVLMHVSLTHLGEGSDDKPNTNSLRGIDAESYYQLGPTERVEMNNSIDPTACVLNPCSLVTQQFVVDALRHWRVQMGVDGFVVDSGGGIARGTYGRSLLLESIANDPVLGGGEGGHHGGGAGAGGGVRLFLTPGEFEVGRMQNWGVWGERVTPAYARDVGAFLEGKNGAVGGFAARVCGSADLIRGERSAGSGHVMNSWTSFPFGGTLADFAKGVAERAGVTPENAAAHARSKTHRKAGGISGRAPVKTRKPLDPTPGETALVVRAMLATLFLSDGVPVVNAGDEYGHSLRGLEDAPKTWKNDANAFRWDAVGVSGSVGCEIGAFLSACASFRRRRHDLFGFGGGNVLWSDLSGEHSPDWEAPTSAPQLMCRRRAATAPGAVAVASVDSMDSVERVTQDAVAIWNCGSLLARAVIGQPPIGYTWVRVLDTALASPADCELAYVSLAGPQGTYLVAPHAVVLLELAPAPEGTAPTTEQVQAARAVEERRAARIPDAARAAPIPTQTRAPTQTTRTPDRQPLEQTPQTAPQTTPPPQTQPQTMQPPPGEFRPPTDPGQTARPNMPAARPQTPSSNPTFRPPP